MKHKLGKILICLFMCFLFIPTLSIDASDDTLEIKNYINDYANLIDNQTEEKLNQAGESLDETTGAQVVFITVDSLNGQDIRQVAYKTFKKYGIGDKDLDNGILFVVSMEEKLRYMEVGTGLESTITDIASQHLQKEYLVPDFQAGNYSQGLEKLYYKTIDAIQNGIDAGELGANPNGRYDDSSDDIMNLITTFIIVVFIILMIYGFGNSSGQTGSISIRPGQRYKLNVRGFNFEDESIIVSSENPNVVQIEGNGWIQGVNVGQTFIYLQKINEQTKKKIPVTVSRKTGSTRRNDRALEYMLWGSMMNNHSRYRNTRYKGGSGLGGFGSGGFSGGGGGSRGGGAGGSW